MNGPAVLAARRSFLRLAAGTLAASVAAGALVPRMARAVQPPLVVWKDPACGCCWGWVQHMKAAGFNIRVSDSTSMDTIKRARGVPDSLWSCHTAVIDGYVIEGHVPAQDIARLLAERPPAKGLAAPGMPASAPGMDQPGEPYAVVLFGGPGGDQTFARH